MTNTILDSGTLRYSISNGEYWLVLDVNPEIGRYARSLIPKSFGVQPPKYPSHITIVRERVPTIQFGPNFGKYDGQRADFAYIPEVANNEVYFWYPAFCAMATDIRMELGLPMIAGYNRPPDGSYSYHITIANTKNKP